MQETRSSQWEDHEYGGLERKHGEEMELIETMRVGEQGAGWDVRVPGVAPKIEDVARTRWAGPDLGAHNDETREGRLQMTSDEIDVLRVQDIIGSRATLPCLRNVDNEAIFFQLDFTMACTVR